jgi:GNAT superfamily N-acetyltransferase
LPEWFGIDEAVVRYVDDVRFLPTFGAWTTDEEPIGFLSVKVHTQRAAEVYVMGVLREHHGRGAGTSLLEAAERDLVTRGVDFLQVKTLGPSHPSEAYAATRRFYESAGFVALEELLDFWPGNPCMLMVKRLAAAGK